MTTAHDPDYLGQCETCQRDLYTYGRRHSYGQTAVRAYGPDTNETHLYCAPCWHGREPQHILDARAATAERIARTGR